MRDNSNDLLTLTNVWRHFPSGEAMVSVLRGIDLTIKQGEMVAIVGVSGSGKSTLMNILGCLDQLSSGNYRIAGQETTLLDADQLSRLRRDHFGFIFQRYHLLDELTAIGNVEIPAVYADRPSAARKKRAEMLLERLSMGDRLNHKPHQLSGGQQQRVSIARALMNNARIILADEPTGALDKNSGEEVLRILEELHAEGYTIIIVTHDMGIAERAGRIVEISDGKILSNRFNARSRSMKSDEDSPSKHIFFHEEISFWRAFPGRLIEACRMAFLSMNAHRVRTFLTMLGVIIGIAAVISMVALGHGTQKQILTNINRLGTNTLTIFAGKSMADVRAAKVTTLVEGDATALAQQPYIAAVTPMVATTTTVRHKRIEANASVSGVGDQFFPAHGARLVEGKLFDANSITNRSLELVIEKESAKILFPDGASPVGQIVLLGKVIARITGVIEMQPFGSGSETLSLYLPYTAVQTRFLGNTTVRLITALLAENTDSHWAEDAVKRLLITRHRAEDFFIRNSEEFLKEVMQSTQVLTLLVASIALISLLVGGIGVMNIMLVTVSDRINEIGVRMAIGARRNDILQQFLIEAVFICFIGGVLGILLGLSVGALFEFIQAPFRLVYSLPSIITAFIFSILVGLVFGYLPASNASRLDPVTALARN